MTIVLDYGQLDPQKVDDFFDEFMKMTGHLFTHLDKRSCELDGRIRNAGLTLADKIEVFKRLAPRAKDSRFGAVTGERKELRMERLLLSLSADELPLFKFALEYDGDYKDMEEYLFHDIDDPQCQERIIDQLKTSNQVIGIKVLTDVDDTMYANLIDQRYPKKTLYPGVVEFYNAVKREPFESQAIPITTLSARPNPVAGILEEASLKSLAEFSQGKLCPSALSGDLVSAAVGSAETWVRAGQEEIDLLNDEIPHGQEDKIGEVKFENFTRFSAIYPEYSFVFVGDSGQADALTAQKMLTETSVEGTSRVVTTFIHDLRQTEDDLVASPSFKKVWDNRGSNLLVISPKSDSGRGIIVFRNYINAAVIAYKHSATLDNLISAEDLAKITKAALEQFNKINFIDRAVAGQKLREQYQQDAEESYQLLSALATGSGFESKVVDIRNILDRW